TLLLAIFLAFAQPAAARTARGALGCRWRAHWWTSWRRPRRSDWRFGWRRHWSADSARGPTPRRSVITGGTAIVTIMGAAAAGTASPVATVESEHELKARVVLTRPALVVVAMVRMGTIIRANENRRPSWRQRRTH